LGLGEKELFLAPQAYVGLYGATVLEREIKMLKKCLFAIAVTALLICTVQAGTPKGDGGEGDYGPDCPTWAYKGHPYPWPVEYKTVEICRIPIWMEVGFWVEIDGCEEAEILLVQTDCEEVGRDADDWPCYYGCTKVNVRTNFEAEIDGDVTHSGWDMSHKELFNGEEPLVIPGDGDWHEVETCVVAYGFKLWKEAAAGVKEEIGYLKFRVKPTGDPP
jgi:hypothetical protein